MASNLGLSVPFKNFLPITGTAALPFTLYFLTLSGRIVYHRVKTHQYMGENIEAKNQPKEAAKNKIVRQEDDPLNLAIRAHQNCECFLSSCYFWFGFGRRDIEGERGEKKGI